MSWPSHDDDLSIYDILSINVKSEWENKRESERGEEERFMAMTWWIWKDQHEWIYSL